MGKPVRKAWITRTTRETEIELELELDGEGSAEIQSGIGFMDHMLTLLTVHGFFNLKLKAKGDLHVDGHHTVEDIGICLGQALAKALGDKAGISRYGYAYVPMDETLARVCLDFSNRPFLSYNVTVPQEKIGDFDSCLAREFLHALTLQAGLTLHVDLIRGENGHHIIEAIFKALGRAIREAATPLTGLKGHLSSKGVL